MTNSSDANRTMTRNLLQSRSRPSSILPTKPSLKGLGQQEAKSQEEHFWKIGYHEAHEESCNEKLQEGFEAGYRNSMEGSMRLGELLGRHAFKGIKKVGHGNGGSGAPVWALKEYLEREQVKDPMDRNANSIKNEMNQVEQHLHGIMS